MPGSSVGIHSSPHKSTEIEVGCYRDSGQTAMPYWILGNTYSTFQQCKQGAINNRYAYFALQNTGSDNRGVCFGSNNITTAKQYGTSTNYKRDAVTNKGLGLNDANFIYQIV